MNKKNIDFKKDYLRTKNNVNLLNKKLKNYKKLEKKFKRLEIFFISFSIICIIMFIVIEYNFNNLNDFIHEIFQQKYIIEPNIYFNESSIIPLNLSDFK